MLERNAYNTRDHNKTDMLDAIAKLLVTSQQKETSKDEGMSFRHHWSPPNRPYEERGKFFPCIIEHKAQSEAWKYGCREIQKLQER